MERWQTLSLDEPSRAFDPSRYPTDLAGDGFHTQVEPAMELHHGEVARATSAWCGC